MTTKTYSELRQQAHFECGRKLVKIAQSVLDDTFVTELEPVTKQTARWAIALARRIALDAKFELDLGYEQTRAPQLAETINRKAWDAYTEAITRFEKRVRHAVQLQDTTHVVQWANGGAPVHERVYTAHPAGF